MESDSFSLDKDSPIGFMDSGLGGISVLREAVKLMPNEDYIYYGDSKNAPYGTKSQDEIRKLTFHAVEYLLDRGIKGLAVACNTATSAAVRLLREKYPNLPIVGIEPAIKPAVEHYKGGRILVLATPMTIKQEKFRNLLKSYANQADIVPISCGGLMEFVERGELEGPNLDDYLDATIGKYVIPSTESMVLGCTHYPFLKKEFKRYLKEKETELKGKEIELIDGSFGTVKELKRRLNEKELLTTSTQNGHVEFVNSSKDPEILKRCQMFLDLAE
ncbi:Glutamate racemase [Lachnospiraceae bacterium TWA4]|nr:Glutamate racemase [Lachnospiraceae bacterium TWA4]